MRSRKHRRRANRGEFIAEPSTRLPQRRSEAETSRVLRLLESLPVKSHQMERSASA
jgi:hypothetical protein